MSERLKVSILAISERENLDPAKLSTKDFVEEKYLQCRRNPLFQEVIMYVQGAVASSKIDDVEQL
jgi:hypothetical protein